MRIAAIDIGTNSIHSTIVEVLVGGPRKTLDDERAYTRLGRGAAGTGTLSESAMKESILALGRILQIAEAYDVTHVRAVATAAVRSAANGQEFISRVREEVGLDVDVISEEEEGRLAFLSAAESFGIEGRSSVLDIGGGSVEIVRATGRQIELIASLPLGVVLLSEMYHATDPISKDDYKRLVRHVRRSIADALGGEREPVARLVGSGGTVSSLGGLIAAKRNLGLTSLHGFEIRRAELVHLLASLKTSSAADRSAMKGMPENRVDIIVSGAVVLDETMRALGANEVVVNLRGIRDGLVIDTLERERGEADRPAQMQSVRDFARMCHADGAHAEKVRQLSLQVFDELGPRLGLDPADRYLLEAGALLHDVGYHIAYERHHKHSYHLISYSELPGFTGRDLRLVAALARYHRGALPKAKHEAMAELTRADRQRVERLAALLRFADGLDRSRGQRVEQMEAEPNGARLTVRISGSGPLDVEAHGAQHKADLFEKVFGLRVDVSAVE